MKTPVTDLEGTILAKGVSLGTDMYETHLNNNVIVFGTPGSFKTEGIVKPNIMQMNSSYVVTDPKGNLFQQMAPMLSEAGYHIACLDFTNPRRSMTYNPFVYADTEEDLDFIVHAIVHAEGRCSKDPFWDDVSELLLKAIIYYCVEKNRNERHKAATFRDVLEVADSYNYRPYGGWESCNNRLDERMEEIRRGIYWEPDGTCKRGYKDSGSMAVKTWQRFRACSRAETTTACAVLEMWAVLNKLGGENKEYLFSNKELIDLCTIGKHKTAVFVIVSDTDRSMDFMVSIFYAQLFKMLCYVADHDCAENHNRLDVPVRVILDDFANQARIEGFDTYMAALRSRDIWLMPICQATAQLEERYGCASNTIIGCCDTVVYTGVNDMKTARELSERADIPLAEIQRLPLETAMVFTRGSAAKFVPHYDIKEHPNYECLNVDFARLWGDKEESEGDEVELEEDAGARGRRSRTSSFVEESDESETLF